MHAETLPDLGHDHADHPPHDTHERRTRWVAAVAAVTMVFELVVGRLSGSMALTADGWHMATHVGALGVAALAYWYARTRAGQRRFPFGTGKVHSLAGYTNAILLAVVACWMILESVERFVHPTVVQFREAFPVAVFGLLVNLVSAKLLDHDHEHHDHNIRAAYMHVLADAFTSVLAILALICGRYLGWTFLDPAMGIVGAVVILRWGWGLIRETSRPLLDATGCEASEARVRTRLESMDDVRVVDLHLWEIGPGRKGCVVSLVTSTPRDARAYREAILAELKLAHLTVEVHPCVHTKTPPSGHEHAVGQEHTRDHAERT